MDHEIYVMLLILLLIESTSAISTPYFWTLRYGDINVSKVDTSSFSLSNTFSLKGKPVGVAVDTLRQRVWMVFDNGKGIRCIDYSGNGLYDSFNGFSLNGIALDSEGNAWFTESSDGQVYEVTVDFGDGGYYDGSGDDSGGSADFQGIAVAPDGYVWATDYNGNKVYKINPSGYEKSATQYTAIQINKPLGIAVNSNNIIFVMNAITTIGMFSNGTIAYSKGGTSRLPDNGKPNRRLYGVVIDVYGNAWCTGGNGYLVEYSAPAYNFLKTIELYAHGVPYNGISTDATGNIWVLTEGDLYSTLVVYDNSGSVIYSAGEDYYAWHFGNWLGDATGFNPQYLFPTTTTTTTTTTSTSTSTTTTSTSTTTTTTTSTSTSTSTTTTSTSTSTSTTIATTTTLSQSDKIKKQIFANQLRKGIMPTTTQPQTYQSSDYCLPVGIAIFGIGLFVVYLMKR